ncbi:MAG: FHA domain-containing protein [Pseudomonadota bacterium]|nr:FHA domain-containing protein [Pseudomonadota bacterium]
MEKKVLLEMLTAHVARYEQHRHYIEKARAQAATGKFNTAVIERVVLDHEIKSSDVADQVQPLLPRLLELLSTIDADKARIEASRGGLDDQIQELELRAAIGEMEEADFEKEVADLRANQTSANERIGVMDTDRGDLQAALDRWTSIAGPAGHYIASRSAAVAPIELTADHAPQAEAAVEAEVEVDADIEPSVIEEVSVDLDASPAPGEEDVHYGVRTQNREDLSVLFSGENGEQVAQVRVASVEEDIAIETSEVGEEDDGDAPSADVPFGFDDEVLGGDVVVGAGEVEIDLSGEGSGPSVSAPAPTGDAGEAPRRALLLYQEGTAEEQIYPFTGDALTIGRGRENDIQIKNDSKVSRYHCKLFRRGNNFYIEDQKSSNGSLVNGELITDRRLFGGEEIIIGETFFRFRIME